MAGGAGTFLAVAGLLVLAAPAAMRSTRHPVSEMHRVTTIGSQVAPGAAGIRFIVVGTTDGTIGSSQIHGAERSLVQHIDPSKEIVRGQEFDPSGSRSFIINITRAVRNGRIIERGRGKWTGGTGRYRRARGTFRIRGDGPNTGVYTVQFVGWLYY